LVVFSASTRGRRREQENLALGAATLQQPVRVSGLFERKSATMVTVQAGLGELPKHRTSPPTEFGRPVDEMGQTRSGQQN